MGKTVSREEGGDGREERWRDLVWGEGVVSGNASVRGI